MNHAVSTHFLVNHRLNNVWLDKIYEAGIPSVEIFCAKQHIDWQNKSQITELAHWFSDAPLKLHSLHSPMFNDEVWGRTGPSSIINIADLNKPRRIAAVDQIKQAIEIAEKIPFRFLIQHLGAPVDDFDEAKLEVAFSSLEEISLFARHRGVEVLLENIPNGLSSAERLNYFLGITHLNLGYCLDVGHANLMDGVSTTFELMKDRIKSTHVHDNNGKEDKHLFPTLAAGGTVNWRETMSLLRSREHQYPLLLELKESPDFPHPLDSIKRIFENLENL